MLQPCPFEDDRLESLHVDKYSTWSLQPGVPWLDEWLHATCESFRAEGKAVLRSEVCCPTINFGELPPPSPRSKFATEPTTWCDNRVWLLPPISSKAAKGVPYFQRLKPPPTLVHHSVTLTEQPRCTALLSRCWLHPNWAKVTQGQTNFGASCRKYSSKSHLPSKWYENRVDHDAGAGRYWQRVFFQTICLPRPATQ